MKYTEFEAKVKEVDASLIVENTPQSLTVRNDSWAGLLRIRKSHIYSIDTSYPTWDRTSDTLKSKLYNQAVELTATPLEEREEPKKKYYYRLPYVVSTRNCLNYDKEDRCISYNNDGHGGDFQTQFTREEYAALAKEHGIPEGVHISEEVTQ